MTNYINWTMRKIYHVSGVGANHSCVIRYCYRYIAKDKIEAYEKLKKNFDDLWSYTITVDVPATIFLWLAEIFDYEVGVSLNEIKFENK